MRFQNINHLIACLVQIRDEHGLTLPVRFSYLGKESSEVLLDVRKSYLYEETDDNEPIEESCLDIRLL